MWGFDIDGVFGPKTDDAVKQVQQGAGLVVDGVVGPLTWAILPSGTPMPRLQEGSTGPVVQSLQQVLTTGAPGGWNILPGAIDSSFGPATKASVQAFQTWGGVTADGFVGDQTWGVQLGAAGATLDLHNILASTPIQPTRPAEAQIMRSAAHKTMQLS
jgi:peptidoglycan hydrolase-like protein with peptidoglycan-binding domain